MGGPVSPQLAAAGQEFPLGVERFPRCPVDLAAVERGAVAVHLLSNPHVGPVRMFYEHGDGEGTFPQLGGLAQHWHFLDGFAASPTTILLEPGFDVVVV